jgi:hypothetical protein
MTMRRLPFSPQQQMRQQQQPGMNEFGEKVITFATLSLPFCRLPIAVAVAVL